MEQGTRDWERLVGFGLAEKVALKDVQKSEGRGDRGNRQSGQMPREREEMPSVRAHMQAQKHSAAVSKY